MKKILVIGTIDETYTNVSGQYDRTEIIKNGLEREGYLVTFVNMMNWKKNIASIFMAIKRGYFSTDNTIFLASLNGTRVMLNLLSFFELIIKKPIFQIAVGGQSNFVFVQNSKWYRERIRKLSAIFVEVESMIDDYKTVGLNNVYYLPNCKQIVIDKKVLNDARMRQPYRFCTYSRVTPEKGIAEAIEVVEIINRNYGENYCTLDIYGTYLSDDKNWFEDLMKSTTKAITYKGRIERKDSIATLSKYDLMLFPTRHTGEGVPGGMIDCYEAGLPIVTCDTSYMRSIIHDGKTGFVYDRNAGMGLIDVILKYTNSYSEKEKMLLRINCQREALIYDSESVINTLSKFIDNT